MTEFQVYLWLMLDNIRITEAVMSFILLIIAVAFLFWGIAYFDTFMCDSEEERTCQIKSGKRKILIGFCVTSLLLVVAGLTAFTPSSKQYATIKIFPKIANSDVAKELPQDAKEMYQMAKDYLKDMMKPEKAK